MATTFDLTIVTPEGKIYEEPVISLQAPGSEGYFGVLAHHAPMVIQISQGVVTVKSNEETAYFAVVGGIVEVSDNHAVMLADLAREADSVEEARQAVNELVATD